MAYAGSVKVLIVGPAWVGDMVMAQALVPTLIESGAIVHALAPAATAPVAERMPGVAAVHRLDVGHGQLGIGQRLRLGRALREHAFDQAIVLPNSFKSALVPWFARIPRRTGWRGEYRYGVLNDLRHLDVDAYPKMVERFVALVGGTCGRPSLRADEANLLESRRALGLGRAKVVVAMCPGAAFGPAKRWPVTHFATVAAKCVANEADVWLFGTAAEKPVCDAICDDVPQVKNLAGRTDLAAAIDLLSVADCVVTNDSGLMHVAAALDRKVIALFGSTSPDFTPPLSDNAVILREPIECSPCFARSCPLGHMKCLVDLAPERVLREIRVCTSS